MLARGACLQLANRRPGHRRQEQVNPLLLHKCMALSLSVSKNAKTWWTRLFKRPFLRVREGSHATVAMALSGLYTAHTLLGEPTIRLLLNSQHAEVVGYPIPLVVESGSSDVSFLSASLSLSPPLFNPCSGRTLSRLNQDRRSRTPSSTMSGPSSLRARQKEEVFPRQVRDLFLSKEGATERGGWAPHRSHFSLTFVCRRRVED